MYAGGLCPLNAPCKTVGAVSASRSGAQWRQVGAAGEGSGHPVGAACCFVGIVNRLASAIGTSAAFWRGGWSAMASPGEEGSPERTPPPSSTRSLNTDEVLAVFDQKQSEARARFTDSFKTTLVRTAAGVLYEEPFSHSAAAAAAAAVAGGAAVVR